MVDKVPVEVNEVIEVLKVPESKPETEKKTKDNTIYVRTSEQLYKRVYAVACNTDFSMSEIVRLCLEQGIDSVQEDLMRARRGSRS